MKLIFFCSAILESFLKAGEDSSWAAAEVEGVGEEGIAHTSIAALLGDRGHGEVSVDSKIGVVVIVENER